MADNDGGEETTSNGNEWEVPKKADNEEVEEASSRGNEWEVVSLTASTYAAAPGSRADESIHEEKGTSVSENDEAETSEALFMSSHFAFPPSEHENLPIEPENMEIPRRDEGGEHVGKINMQKEGKSEEKEEENWNMQGLDELEDFSGIQVFDEKGNRRMSIHGPEFDEATAFHGLNVDDKDKDMYETAKYGFLHSGSVTGESAEYYEGAVVSDLVEQSDDGTVPSAVIPRPPDNEKDELDGSELPSGGWWKRKMVLLCAQAKDTSAFWSIFVAAAVMGLVILGQHWQQERWQVLQQRWHHSISDEKSGRILSRLKDVIVGGTRRGTYVTAATAER